MKNKWMIIVIGIIACSLMTACAATPANPTDSTVVSQINANGTGQVYLTPDVAYIFIGVHSQSKDVAEALAQNNTQSQDVSQALQDMGVEAKDIQTTAFNVYPQQQYSPTGEPADTEYVVENSVYVTVRDLHNLGALLDKAVKSGANSINGVQFDVLDKSAALAEARKTAVDNAKTQAQELAGLADVNLGRLLSLNIYTSSPAPMADKGGATAMNSGVPMAAGQLVITVEANISYEVH